MFLYTTMSLENLTCVLAFLTLPGRKREICSSIVPIFTKTCSTKAKYFENGGINEIQKHFESMEYFCAVQDLWALVHCEGSGENNQSHLDRNQSGTNLEHRV